MAICRPAPTPSFAKCVTAMSVTQFLRTSPQLRWDSPLLGLLTMMRELEKFFIKDGENSDGDSLAKNFRQQNRRGLLRLEMC